MKPIRIQRKRTKGWKMPENTIYVGRNNSELGVGPFSNPFKIGCFYKIGNGGNYGMTWCMCIDEKYANGFTKVIDNAHAVEMFKEYISKYPLSKENIEKIRGKNLACWCTLDKPCHADELLKIANETT